MVLLSPCMLDILVIVACVRMLQESSFTGAPSGIVAIGVSKGDLCPGAALPSYMMQWGNHDGLFFMLVNSNHLFREGFVAQLCETLSEAWVDCTLYPSHSFRIAVATTAAMSGIQDSIIKTLGRWVSGYMYMLYIRTPPSTLHGSSLKGPGVLMGASVETRLYQMPAYLLLFCVFMLMVTLCSGCGQGVCVHNW